MNRTLQIFAVACLIFAGLAVAAVPAAQARTPLIQRLYKSILADQVQNPTKWIPFIRDETTKGLFPSFIHPNFHGNEVMYELRERARFWDANSFVTNWVLQTILETEKLGAVNIAQTAQSHFVDAVQALLLFKDRNFEQGVPIVDFWPQTLNKDGKWQQFPTNIGYAIIDGDGLGHYIAEAVARMGYPDIAKQINGSLSMLDEAMSAFHIPADFDDSSVNLALGIRLAQSSVASSVSPIFNGAYSNWAALADAWVEFAYAPFSSNPNATTSIDPRTYFWIRGFLDQEAAQGNKNLLLISTWAQNLRDDISNFYSGDKMPFNANNVDASVSANGVYALTLAALTSWSGTPGQLPNWFSADLQQMYTDTARMLAWTVNTNVMGSRPDLALLYYPPIYDFYWFVARSVHELSSVTQFPFPGMAIAAQQLTSAMMNAGTQQLLAMMKSDSTGAFWDDFLGDADTDIWGMPLVRGEDRIFSTAVATSALIDTWTVASPGSKCIRSWRQDVPNKIKAVITSAANWLTANVESGKYALENAFFSGSMKSMEQGPWFFPANVIQDFNGNPISPTNKSAVAGDIIDLVEGYIPKAEYEQLLNQQWFGMSVPIKFSGYNATPFFPYWSSPTFTRACVMLTLAKVNNLETCRE